MKKGRYVLLLLLFLIGCGEKQQFQTAKPLSAKEIIGKSIEFHDPNELWGSLSSRNTLISNSIYTDSLDERVVFAFNNSSKQFLYSNKARNVELLYRPEGCISLDSMGTCEDYEWASRFYPFIWGLPMKLSDPSAQINQEVGDTNILGRNCHVIYNSYDTENWEFYIDKHSYMLNGFKFVFKSDHSTGEVVIHSGIQDMNGIKTPLKRQWYDLNMNPIGTDIFVKSDSFNISTYAK